MRGLRHVASWVLVECGFENQGSFFIISVERKLQCSRFVNLLGYSTESSKETKRLLSHH